MLGVCGSIRILAIHQARTPRTAPPLASDVLLQLSARLVETLQDATGRVQELHSGLTLRQPCSSMHARITRGRRCR